MQPKFFSEKDTTSTTEPNNNNTNNIKTNDNPAKVDDNRFLEPSVYLLEQTKATAEAEVERWEKERMEESGRQKQLKRQQLECEQQHIECDQQYQQQEVQRQAYQ